MSENAVAGVKLGDLVTPKQLHVVFDHQGGQSFAAANPGGDDFPVPMTQVAFAASLEEIRQIGNDMEALMQMPVSDEKAAGVIGLGAVVKENDPA